MMMAPLHELRQRGIEFLLAQREKDKQPNELSVKELMQVMKCSESTVYSRMETLVDQGLWKMRHAYDTETHRVIKVWWLVVEDKKEGS